MNNVIRKIIFYIASILLFITTITACAASQKDETQIPAEDNSKNTAQYSDFHSIPKVNGILAKWLEDPTDIAFLPNGSALITERKTRKLQRISEHRSRVSLGEILDESGIKIIRIESLALSPQFIEDNFIYIYATTAVDSRILQLSYNGLKIEAAKPIVTALPKISESQKGSVAFGPDNNLYLGTNSAEVNDETTQSSLSRKIIRLSPEVLSQPEILIENLEFYGPENINAHSFAWDSNSNLWYVDNDIPNKSSLRRIINNIDLEDNSEDNPQWSVTDSNIGNIGIINNVIYATDLKKNRLWKLEILDNSINSVEYFFDDEYGSLGVVGIENPQVLWIITNNTGTKSSSIGVDDRILRVTLDQPSKVEYKD